MEKTRNITNVTTILLLSFGLLICTTLLVVTLFATVAEAKSAGVLLQEGVYAEEIEGNLDAAIRIYEQAIDEARTVERVAAQATYRIGMCYLKKGEEEQAAAYFQDVVSKFPQQKPLVAKAQEHLAKLKPPIATTDTFGPVIGRTVNDDGAKENFLIDFESGRLFTPPAELRGADKRNALTWMEENGIDAVGETGSSSPGLGCVDMAVIPLANARWEGISAEELTEELSIAKPGTEVMMSVKGELPATYMFKTREGGMGVVQITKMVNNVKPRHFEIRYKMLEEQTGAGELLERAASAEKLRALGKAMLIYANDDEQNRHPDTLRALERLDYITKADLEWALGNVAYLGKGKTAADPPDTVLAYDKHLLRTGDATNVLFNDSYVGFAQADELKALRIKVVDSRPYRPVVIASVPATYSNDVSPELSEISVTFDRAMADGSWSWVRWNYRYPETPGKPRYDSTRTTCSLPVKLEAGKAYFVRINAAPYTSFRSADGVSAQPYVLVFATKDENGNPTPIPEDMLAKAKEINSIKPQPPYTQELFADISPDGTLNFKTTVKTMNEGGAPITTTSFINSDFVNVTAMHDDKGRPIEFTTVREGSHRRYHATFNEPVGPGDMMVYSHEGTMTGSIKSVPGEKDTFQHYMRHHPSAGQPTLRIETYLLPEGAELISTTPPDMQRRTMDGRTELHVEELIPAGGSITTTFKYRLAGAQLAEAKPLELIPAPFFDGEVMRLKLSTPVGAEIGQVIYTTEAVEQKGQYPWRIRSYMHIAATNMQQYTQVDADRMTLAPISSRTKNWLGDFQATYSPDAVQLVSNIKGAKSSKDFALTGPVYDNEQAMYVIRSLPLKEGYSASFDIFPIQSGVVSECRIRVTGTEKVRLRPGLIECFAIELSVYAQGIKALTHHLWISTEEDRRLVKYDSGTAIMELMGTERRNKERPQQVVDALNGYSFELPHGWHNVASQGPYKASTQLLAPELKARAVFIADERPSQIQSAREVAEGEVERVKGFFKDYSVRAASWVERDIGGLPAAQYVADYEDKAAQMVEYRTYLLGESLAYRFVFRIERDQFVPNRPEFDSIVNSFAQMRWPEIGQKRAGESLAANGWRLWRQRKLVEAEKAFKEAVEKDPTNANAWNGLGWSQSNQGKPLNAKISFEKCLEIEPEHAAALNGLGWIAKGDDKTDEAIGYWEKAVEAMPTATASLNGLATTYMELKQFDKAIQYYEMWLKAEPDNTDAKAGLAKAVASHQSR